MVKLTVFLVRHGQCVHEVTPPPGNALTPLHQFYQPDVTTLQEIMGRLDPELTDLGYQQAQGSFTSLARALTARGDVRKIGNFASPYQRCTASALMISVAGFEPQEWSNWGLTTPTTQKAPTAIPIAVVNGLADCTKEVKQLGGITSVIEAGLILGAACPWNKAYKKDPLMGQVQRMKDINNDRIEAWMAAATSDDVRFVADVQYLRLQDDNDPYSLTQMSTKFNIVTELIKPNKYMQPPRKGCYESKPLPEPVLMGQEWLDYSVSMARLAGCDTVIVTTTAEIIQEVCDRAGKPVGLAGPGDICCLYAKFDDNDGALSWSLKSTSQYTEFGPSHVPKFTGPVTPSVPMPPEFAMAMAEAGEEKWGNFPPPPPEVIPSSYPKDIPAFGTCLSQPEPEQKWAWVSKPPKFK